MWVGYVGVDDVDATAQKITRLGGAVHVPPTNASDISRFSVFTDPQAAKLALFKWLKAGQQPPTAPSTPGSQADRRRFDSRGTGQCRRL